MGWPSVSYRTRSYGGLVPSYGESVRRVLHEHPPAHGSARPAGRVTGRHSRTACFAPTPRRRDRRADISPGFIAGLQRGLIGTGHPVHAACRGRIARPRRECVPGHTPRGSSTRCIRNITQSLDGRSFTHRTRNITQQSTITYRIRPLTLPSEFLQVGSVGRMGRPNGCAPARVTGEVIIGVARKFTPGWPKIKGAWLKAAVGAAEPPCSAGSAARTRVRAGTGARARGPAGTAVRAPVRARSASRARRAASCAPSPQRWNSAQTTLPRSVPARGCHPQLSLNESTRNRPRPDSAAKSSFSRAAGLATLGSRTAQTS